MKKTILTILLCGVLVLGLTGCGANNTILSVNGEKLNYDEIIKIYEENEAEYENNYKYKTVTIEGIVEKIGTSSYYNYYCLGTKDNKPYEHYTAGVDTYNIFLKDGFVVRVNKNMDSDIDISSLKKGDKLKITSQLVQIWKTERDDDKLYVNLYAHSKGYVCGESGGSSDEALSGSIIEKIN